ncbi:copper amine oxidase N-terminal domain-containing protein [Paenibacillus faecis]|uniref:Copper amine oxidase N-terminal domain-containing protein n=2 Tax=Paenibacillus TaxID=44249 RepID=A0A5D0D0B5_9BACL|nr:copper amine oxidase N-terminal domain-containing protein [Paenibacillus faecis]
MYQMKMKKQTAAAIALAATLVSGTVLANTTFAAEATKTLKAVYSNIKLVYNGQTISSTSGQEPFVVDGSTYVPIRMAGEALGKSLYWDGAAKQIQISDLTAPIDQATIDSLNKQIKDLESQVTSLKKELSDANSTLATKNQTIASLETQLNAQKNSTSKGSLDKLEDKLNKDYEDYYSRLDAEISLSGDKNDITVKVEVDQDAWDDLTSNRKKTFIQAIVDDILKEFNRADVSGTVRNESSKKLTSFSVSSSGNVTLSSSGVADKDDMLDKLKRNFGTYRGIPLSIRLTVDEDDEEAVVKVYVEKDDWDRLSSTDQNALLRRMIDELASEYRNYDIDGYVYDDDNNGVLDKRV